MPTRQEIERVLRDELHRARTAHEQAKEEFKITSAEIPSGLPHPDGVTRIANAGNANASALVAYARAVKEFNDFILHGIIPERLKDSDEREKSRP